jgi:hypothetical protein
VEVGRCECVLFYTLKGSSSAAAHTTTAAPRRCCCCLPLRTVSWALRHRVLLAPIARLEQEEEEEEEGRDAGVVAQRDAMDDACIISVRVRVRVFVPATDERAGESGDRRGG